MALFGIVAAVATNSITMVQALGGYAEANVWLIVAAVFFLEVLLILALVSVSRIL